MSFRTIPALAVLVALLVAGCSHLPSAPQSAPADQVARFSGNWSGRSLPQGWAPWLISRTKGETRYELVVDPQTEKVVLHAKAEKAASGLAQSLAVEPAQRPQIAWRWRVNRLIESADNADPYAEDAPVRLMLFFDGDRASLPFKEQMLAETARLLSGREAPYATLMYVWENRLPAGTLIPNSHTGQVKMIVASQGAAGLGQWQSLERDYVADYRRAFGAEPGKLIGIGVMTDTDNTGERAEAWYGDIELRTPQRAAAR